MNTATDASWKLCLFGKLRLAGPEFHIDQFDTRRSALLLARLAISHRHAITRADAADLLWPDDFYDATRIRLRQELSRLRRALGPARQILDTDEDWIRLSEHDLSIDVGQFEECFRLARASDTPDEQVLLYRRAIDMSSEDLLAGFHEPWIDVERRRLAELRYAMLLDLAAVLSRAGDHQGALDAAQQAVDSDPLREAGHLLVMQELGHLGHLSDALDQYQQLKRLLRDEAQTAPSEEADRLVEALRQVPSVAISPRSVAGELIYAVPAPPEPIYGRESEVCALVKLLNPRDSKVRLVTLTGPGGIGKTRLATETALSLQEGYSGRVAWVSVADISDPSLIAYEVVRTLGITIGQTADPMDRLVALLPREPILLVIDNLEQLLPDAVPVLKSLVESRPNLRILTTSRIPLNLAGERAVPVPPLPIPGKRDSVDQPALRIFLDPLLAEQGFQQPTEAQLAVFRQIAERLEGFPLALQLASARLRTLTPEELLGQLDNRLDSLVNRRADAPERHRTLRAALGGSYQSLPTEQQKALGRLAVFRGGWSHKAAARVCGVSDAVPLLEQLLDSSLIRVDREDRGLRFRMFESIRDFALEALSEDERLEAYRSHTDWMLELGRPLIGRSADNAVIEHFKLVDPEIDNLREACRFALEYDLPRAVRLAATFGQFWYSRGLSREAIRFLGQVLGRRDEVALSEDLARAAFTYSQLLQASHIVAPGSEGPPAFDLAAELCASAGLRVEAALVRSHRAHTNIAAADMDGALALLEEGAATLNEKDEPRDVAFMKHGIAVIKYYKGEIEDAVRLMQEAKAIFERFPTPFAEVQNLQMMSFMYYELRDMDRAEESAQLGLAAAEQVGAKHHIPMIQEILARVALSRKEYDLADQWAQAAADGWEAYGNMFQHADQLQLLGRIAVDRGDFRRGLEFMNKAAQIFSRLGVTPFLPLCLHGAAKAWVGLGQCERATRILGASDKARKPTGAEDLGSELEYVDEIRATLIEKMGRDAYQHSLDASPTLDEALKEAFDV